jgi:trigger factor
MPMGMVKKRYLPQVQQELLGETLHYAFFDAMDKEGYNPAGYPSFDDVKVEKGQISFQARFDTYPEITLPAFNTLEVEKVSAEVKDEDVEKMIQRLQEQRSAWKPAGAAKKASMGEQVIIDFLGKLDGVEFEGGKAEDVPLELGSGRMIPGFEDGIIGMKKGETKTIDVTFPEQYQAAHLAGKTAQFDITVHSVQVKQLPELDEEFIKSFGIEDGTAETMRKEIRDNMERELKRTLDAKNRQATFDALEKAVEIDVPKSSVAQEAEGMLENYMQRLEQQGMPKGQMPGLTADIFNEEAKKRVKLGLVIGEIIKVNDIKATEDDLDAFIAEQASAYEEPDEIKQWYKENPQRLNEARSVIVESAVAKKIMAEANVTEVNKAFDEIVSSSAA